MNVKQLIEFLSQQDPNMRVVVQGYEQGYDEVHLMEHVRITPNMNNDKPWWDGEFNETSSENAEIALWLPRGGRPK